MYGERQWMGSCGLDPCHPHGMGTPSNWLLLLGLALTAAVICSEPEDRRFSLPLALNFEYMGKNKQIFT